MSSDSFWPLVSRLFALFDLSGSGFLSRSEVSLALGLSYDFVQREENPSSPAEKAQAVAKQVDWLFQAAAGEEKPESIDEAQFRACYSALLSSGYEEEVLLVDLKRAVAALEGSEDFLLSHQLFKEVRKSADSGEFARALPVNDFPGLSSLGPKKHRQAVSLLSSLGSPRFPVSSLLPAYGTLASLGVSAKSLAEHFKAARIPSGGE